MRPYARRKERVFLAWIVKVLAVLLCLALVAIQAWTLALLTLPLLLVDYVSSLGFERPRERYDLSRGVVSSSGRAWVAPFFLVLEVTFVVYLFIQSQTVQSQMPSVDIFGSNPDTRIIKGNLGHASSSSVDPRDKSIHRVVKDAPLQENMKGSPIYSDSMNKGSGTPVSSHALIASVLGSHLPTSAHPELRRWSPQRVRESYQRLFEELPSNGFDSQFKNPCWLVPVKDLDKGGGEGLDNEKHHHHQHRAISPRAGKPKAGFLGPNRRPQQHGRGLMMARDHDLPSNNNDFSTLACLPYAYVLGMPKCGTSDLFERLARHPQVAAPEKKEIRWFTRGEFTWTRLDREDGEHRGVGDLEERRLGRGSSVYSFTHAFDGPARVIRERPLDTITIDGGPHTLWWGVQNSNGHLEEEDVPVPQILSLMQPNAKFIITIADPVKRLFSDYYFLDDNLKVAAQNQRQKERIDVLTRKYNDMVATYGSLKERQKAMHEWRERITALQKKVEALEEEGADTSAMHEEVESQRRDFRRRDELHSRLEKDFRAAQLDKQHDIEQQQARNLPDPTEKSSRQFHARSEEQMSVMRKCVLKEMYDSRAAYTAPNRPGSMDAEHWDTYVPSPGSPGEPFSGDWSNIERMEAWWALMTHLAARDHSESRSSSAQHEAILALLSDIDYMKSAGADAKTVKTTGTTGGDTALLQSFFRASQICAHDRYRLARGGWGRLSLGLYALFYHKWLEHFPPSAFHWLRLEHYNGHERAHLAGLFEFLGITSGGVSSRVLEEQGEEASSGSDEDSFWRPILEGKAANVNHRAREPMWEETEKALRKFYLPYNILLARFIIEGHQTHAGTANKWAETYTEDPGAYLYERLSQTSVSKSSSSEGTGIAANNTAAGDAATHTHSKHSSSIMAAFEETVDREKKKRAAALRILEEQQEQRGKRRRDKLGVRSDGGESVRPQNVPSHANQHGHFAGRHGAWEALPARALPSPGRPSVPGKLRGSGMEEDDQEEPEARDASTKKEGTGKQSKRGFGDADWSQPVHVVPKRFEIGSLPQRKPVEERRLSYEQGDKAGEASALFDTWLAGERIIDTAVWMRHVQLQRQRAAKEVDTPPSSQEESADFDGYSGGDALEQLCAASFAQDIAALKFLLWDVGIPADTVQRPTSVDPSVNGGGKRVTLMASIDHWYGEKARNKHGGDDDAEQRGGGMLEEGEPAPLSTARKLNLLGHLVPAYEKAASNAWACLALVRIMGDAHPKSHVFAALKGRPSWLTPYLSPPNYYKETRAENKVRVSESKQYQWKLYEDTAKTFDVTHSVLARDLVDALAESTANVSQWLVAAGVTPRSVDMQGNTPLIHAASGGMEALTGILIRELRVSVDPLSGQSKVEGETRVALEKAVLYLDLNVKNYQGRTALHYAVANGHAATAKLLVEAGADMDLADHNGVTARSLLMTPGSVTPEAAHGLFGVKQRPPRKIDRLLHPGNSTNRGVPKQGWPAGTGGWREDRLASYESDMSCDIDQYWADELNPQELFHKYVAHMKPVMIRGLIGSEHWPAIDKYKVENLGDKSKTGDIKVQVSDIPYANKFGGAPRVDMTLSEYVDEVLSKTMPGGAHPWYVFKGHPIPDASEAKDSLVHYTDTPTPPLIHEVYKSLANSNGRRTVPDNVPPRDRKSRELYINAQWALGGAGTGAPVHYHNSAWNMLVYGAKKWFLYSPRNAIMSNKQIKEYTESDMKLLERRGLVQMKGTKLEGGGDKLETRNFNTLAVNHSVTPMVCVQTAGDVMIVPEAWGHGVLNIQDSVAVATETRAAMWRTAGPDVLKFIPSEFDNRRFRPKQ